MNERQVLRVTFLCADGVSRTFWAGKYGVREIVRIADGKNPHVFEVRYIDDTVERHPSREMVEHIWLDS